MLSQRKSSPDPEPIISDASLDSEVLDFYRKMGRSADQVLNESEIKASRFLETALDGSDLHRQVAMEITMTRPPHIKPGSAGAYLYGCLGVHDGVQLSCTPSCLHGFQLPDQIPCQVPVWVCDDFGLTKLNNVDGDSVYVFSQRKLTSAERALLVKEGVKKASLFTRDDKTYRETPIRLTKSKDEDATSDPVPKMKQRSDDDEDSNVTGIILVLVILVVVVIIIVVGVMWAKSRDHDADVPESQTYVERNV